MTWTYKPEEYLYL